MSTEENKTVTILARHDFTDSEIRGIAVKMAGVAQSYSATESEFASVKQDFKAKLDRLELDRDTLVQRIRDGFEMRPTLAFVRMNDPAPGRKTFLRAMTCDNGMSDEVIREEPMDATDFQRELPLESSKCDFISLTYGHCQLCSGHSGEHSFDGHALEKLRCMHGEVIAEDGGNECDQCARDAATIDPERFPETGDSSAEIREAREVIETAAENIGTSIAQKLTEAAAGKELTRVVIDFSAKDSSGKCIAKWRKSARAQGWPEPCIAIIDDIACGAETKARVLDVLGAHSISALDKATEAVVKDASEKLAATFSGANEEDVE